MKGQLDRVGDLQRKVAAWFSDSVQADDIMKDAQHDKSRFELGALLFVFITLR